MSSQTLVAVALVAGAPLAVVFEAVPSDAGRSLVARWCRRPAGRLFVAVVGVDSGLSFSPQEGQENEHGH